MTVAWTLVTAAAACVALVVGRRWMTGRRELDRRRGAARHLPGVVSNLARSVGSGATLTAAVREVAPGVGGELGHELRAVVALLDRGYGTDRVLALWGRATVIDGVDLLVATCRFSVANGAGLVGALDGVAATLLDKVEVSDEITALASQARVSTMALLALPPVGAALFALVDPSVAGVLFGTTAGRLCLTIGVGLDLLGWRVSRMLLGHALNAGAV